MTCRRSPRRRGRAHETERSAALERERDAERGPRGAGLEGELAAMRVDDALHDRETESGPRRLRREEGLEDRAPHVRRDPRAGVADVDARAEAIVLAIDA